MRRATNKPGTFPLIVRDSIAVAVLFLMLSSCGFAQAPAAKVAGTVKSTSGNTLILSLDAGTDTTVTIADSARILRTLPGQTDLKAATPISALDIHVGDRVFAKGQTGDNGTIMASSIIVMAKTDIAQKQQQERDEWRKGVGGIVSSVDVAGNTITLKNSILAGGKPVMVHVSKDTSIRRYAPDSVKFDDAKPSALDEIKAGDQLRARGTKNADATEFTAQAIVSGSFRDVAGTVVSTDAATNSFTIMDLSTKKAVVVKVGPESQLHKLPTMAAQMIAFRLKGGATGAAAGPGSQAGSQRASGPPASGSGNWNGDGQGGWNRGSGGGQGGAPAGGAWRNANGGSPDFQQMLSRMPEIKIADLNKGDAVMLVATEGTANNGPTAITVLAGVEPILTAAPAGTSASTLLSPWNLGTNAGGGDLGGQ